MRILQLAAFGTLVTACSSTPATAIVVNDAGIVTFDGSSVVVTPPVQQEDAAAPEEDAAAPKEAAAPSVTFTRVYGDIISPICVQCHNPNGIGVSMGHLDMSTKDVAFGDLVNVQAMGSACGGMGTRVVPGNAADSIMFKKIDPGQPAPCGSKMPLGLPALSTAQTDEIQSWINAGAKND